MQDNDRSSRRELVLKAVCALVLVAAIGMRLYGAWCYRHSTDPNFAITSVMAKHIAEGAAFPVFYYGQEYMGTGESFAGAPFCRLLGPTGFAVNLGAAVFGVLVLLVTAAWARRIGGYVAALAAVALLIVGPEVFFLYTACNLGYAIILLCCLTVLWLGAAITEDRLLGAPLRLRDFFLLGLAAGAGWWSSQVIVFPLFATAAVFLLFLGFRVVVPRAIFGGAAGLAIGAAPWWVWNVLNDFRSLKVASSFRPEGFLSGVRALGNRTLPHLVGADALPPWLGRLALALAAAALVGTLYLLIRALRRPGAARATAPAPSFAALLIVIPVALVIYCLTRFGQKGSSRYLLLFVPVAAVMAGAVTEALVRRVRGWGWLPLVALAALQYPVVPAVRREAAEDDARWREARGVGFFLAAHSDAAYIGYADRWMSFAIGEEPPLWPMNGVRYEPYWEAIERARQPAVLRNAGEVAVFLAASGGTVQKAEVNGADVFYDFRPPEGGLAPVDPAQVAGMTADGRDAMAVLRDHSYVTAWTKPGDADGRLEIAFAPPVTLTALRLALQNERMQGRFQLFAVTPESPDWQPLTGMLGASDFQWWGDRPFWQGQYPKLEFRFAPRTVTRLRVDLPAGRRRTSLRPAEVECFGPAPASANETASLPALRALLADRDVRALYCDRWVRGRLASEPIPGLELCSEPYLSDRSDTSFDPIVHLGADTGLLVRSEDLLLLRRVLARAHVQLAETPVGPWVLLDFDAGHPWMTSVSRGAALRWMGWGALLLDERRLALGDALIAGDLLAAGRPAEAVPLLEGALARLPDNVPAMRWLADAWMATGRAREASDLRHAAETAWRPATPVAAEFDGGVRLLGVTVEGGDVKRGEPLRVDWFWSSPARPLSAATTVFSHFVGPDGETFQDDRVLELADVGYQPLPWVFVERRELQVPRNAKPGTYELWAGLYDAVSGERQKVRATLRVDRRAVCVPVTVRVR